MEFRCPACDTSYRVPVRIDQQVRCARCNHVWRIAESDFVFEDDAQDEGEMPEAFSSPGFDDDHDVANAEAEIDDDLSKRVAWPEDESGRQTDEPATRAIWPDADRVAGEDERARDFETLASAPEPTRHDTAFDTQTEHASTVSPEEEEADSLDRRLAGTWFAGATDQAETAPSQPDPEPHAGFERIMEGIEDVIAESSGSDEAAGDRAEPQAEDPLRALMSEERARHLGGTPQSDTPAAAPLHEDDWSGKVVRLTARGGQRDVESHAQDRTLPADDDGVRVSSGESVEPMAELIDKIAAGRAEPSDFVEPDESTDNASSWEDTANGHTEQMGNAHFAALQADLEDAAHAVAQPADPYAQENAEPWATEAYHDEAHEEAQRESLAFDPAQDAFEMQDTDLGHRDAMDDRAAAIGRDEDDFLREETGAHVSHEEAGDTWRDEPADIFAMEPDDDVERRADPAVMDTQDDDALLAEYDFGEEAADEAPPEAAASARRGSGTLTVAAAWALFVAVMGAAAVSAISFRDQVADALPASAPLYAAVGFPADPPPLVFGEVGYSWAEGTANTLILTGQVTNNRGEMTEMPDMQITARDDSGAVVAEESQFLGQSALMPNETLDFRVQVEVPPEQLETVELRF